MELRRALLLFVIVLGVAAVVASLTSPSRRDQGTNTAPAAARPADVDPVVTIRFDADAAPRRERVEVGRAARLIVASDEPGVVELAGLGLTDVAEPRDPATFELFPTTRGRFEVRFTPSGGVRARALGELVSRPAK